ncbi:MAG: helix-turn-helix transcriptional regulator [Butyrivibrio sp.]|uniref:Helix-turn-helix n=1 Tax=Butyrivibrio fibrisolvens TaxID=831 RepID=A0A1H9VHR8_BUTFI|nr:MULTISPECIES: helix-turn-helix transcriptional regulator [Butyrivibrio]MBP3197531.1 helix-turn-helix transcriptional regulator [Butyrivibrio sp.]SES21081.1 Helix-turn-helix [Butyrivibrio fibrisolvens]
MNSSEKIKIIRQLSKKTQTEFGESLGVSKATISNLETERVPIPGYIVLLLKLLYNIDPDWLQDDNQSDFEKRFYDKNVKSESDISPDLLKKFNSLKNSYKKIITKAIEECYLVQNEEGEQIMVEMEKKQ